MEANKINEILEAGGVAPAEDVVRLAAYTLRLEERVKGRVAGKPMSPQGKFYALFWAIIALVAIVIASLITVYEMSDAARESDKLVECKRELREATKGGECKRELREATKGGE